MPEAKVPSNFKPVEIEPCFTQADLDAAVLAERERERERCAKIAESWNNFLATPQQQEARNAIAAKIRSGK